MLSSENEDTFQFTLSQPKSCLKVKAEPKKLDSTTSDKTSDRRVSFFSTAKVRNVPSRKSDFNIPDISSQRYFLYFDILVR